MQGHYLTMFTEDDLLPISALQHMRYCPRQCALIHLEQVWVENRYTAEGRLLHATVDEGGSSMRGGVLRQTSVPVRSLELGLTGVVDVVEFHGEGRIPFPVEFKRGKPKANNCDRVQLCAQAMCLEESCSQDVPEGALFYGKNRRRELVLFQQELREFVRATARDIHEMLASKKTPPPAPPGQCARCSMKDVCRPEAARKRQSVAAYISQGLHEP